MPRIDYDESWDSAGNLLRRTPRVVSDDEIYLNSVDQLYAALPWATITPDQAEAWLNTNVTDLASARQALILMARFMIVLKDLLRQQAIL